MWPEDLFWRRRYSKRAGAKLWLFAVKSGLIKVVEIEVEGTPATKRRGGGVVRWESKVVLSPTDGTALAP
ncbi:uncharacterized protein PpBr36_05900 [Pyricularia pennisetigena]|uniref:uncharacterized protein n=1 Tax=Pyricularia pennisetigena TaxID=1578925 RepID=UPI001154A0CE|nr:uncharacterized protein PpBr36_05900 [Pyricularia pennisetigena]TLS23105.1 hypothetical protein PpBr36_05900 [Pyricularia pennisetigena]